MNASKLMLMLGLALAMVSCQKEITDGTPEQPGGGGTGGNTDGNRIVKGVQITPSTGDTNIVTIKWDANGKLLEYNSNGEVNNIVTAISVKISRAADGKINTIVTSSSLPNNFIDSIVTKVFYVPGSSKLAYSVGTSYSMFGEVADSALYTYNGAGKLITKENFLDFFGSMEPSTKQQYEYDGNGNVIKVLDFSHDGVTYVADGTTINTYDGHKGPNTFEEAECFVSLGPALISVNNPIKTVSNAVSSGTTHTLIVTDLLFNSFDRPYSATLTLNPIPPGYVNKVTYYYQ
jgi:hypothetical protein